MNLGPLKDLLNKSCSALSSFSLPIFLCTYETELRQNGIFELYENRIHKITYDGLLLFQHRHATSCDIMPSVM